MFVLGCDDTLDISTRLNGVKSQKTAIFTGCVSYNTVQCLMSPAVILYLRIFNFAIRKDVFKICLEMA
jgi:hypothetical protein